MTSVDGIRIIRSAEEACDLLQNDSVIGIDTETTGLSPYRDHIALMQFYGEQTGTLAVIQTPSGVIPQCISDLFTPDKTFVIHNGVGFDMQLFATHGLPWRNPKWHDTLVGETLLSPTNRRNVSKSLRASLRRRLGKDIDKDIEHGHWEQDLSDRQLEYAAQDVISLPALYRSHLEIAQNSNQMDALNMEMELAPIVAQMSVNGLPCKRAAVEEFVEMQKQKIAEAEEYLHRTLGKINLNSSKQLLKALREYGFDINSTSKETLLPLVQYGGEGVEVLENLLNWKHGAQRIRMYSPAWCNMNITNDYVHPHFWQCSADTTRFTCSDPNMQQIPRDSRFIIGGMDGISIVSVDYSQIEVRIAAHLANDETLIASLEGDGDAHTMMASAVFQVPPEQVTKEQRKFSKALTFTLLFGGGVDTLYDYVRMGGGSITKDQAADLVLSFFNAFTGLRLMKDKAHMLARKDGPVFLRLPNSSRRLLIGDQKRPTVILNTLVQGSAAVGIKYGILEAERRGLGKYLGGQVHDELVAAVPDNEAEEYARELSDAMIVGMGKVLPRKVLVEAKIGRTWL